MTITVRQLKWAAGRWNHFIDQLYLDYKFRGIESMIEYSYELSRDRGFLPDEFRQHILSDSYSPLTEEDKVYYACVDL